MSFEPDEAACSSQGPLLQLAVHALAGPAQVAHFEISDALISRRSACKMATAASLIKLLALKAQPGCTCGPALAVISVSRPTA